LSAESQVPGPTVSPLELVRRLDPRVIVPVALLVLIGLVSIGEARASLVAPQLRWVAAGFAVTCMVMLVPYRRILDLAWPLWGFSVALLLAVLVFGESRNGAKRWLQFGPVGLQPSEFAKVAQIVVMARYVRFRRDHRTFKGLFVPFLITLVPVSLILAEPDLGTAAMFVPPLFVMLWAAGARTKHLLVVVGLGVASLPVLYTALPEGHYQRGRVDAFVASVAGIKLGKPGEGAAPRVHDTFQRDEAVAAVASGGVAGHSPSADEPSQHERVPESWTDFVFVVHAEEWGLAGVLALLAVWTALLAGLASLASELKEPAARLLCVGALVLLGTQALVNMAMTMGAFPVTGVPLPFVSYGGSSMLASWLLVALVLHAKARQPVVFSVGDFD
jgi:cell division protein FtsW (lipid II flippase)